MSNKIAVIITFKDDTLFVNQETYPPSFKIEKTTYECNKNNSNDWEFKTSLTREKIGELKKMYGEKIKIHEY